MTVALAALVFLCWAFLPAEERGAFGGLGRLFLFVPAALVLLAAWVATAFLK